MSLCGIGTKGLIERGDDSYDVIRWKTILLCLIGMQENTAREELRVPALSIGWERDRGSA